MHEKKHLGEFLELKIELGEAHDEENWFLNDIDFMMSTNLGLNDGHHANYIEYISEIGLKIDATEY